MNKNTEFNVRRFVNGTEVSFEELSNFVIQSEVIYDEITKALRKVNTSYDS